MITTLLWTAVSQLLFRGICGVTCIGSGCAIGILPGALVAAIAGLLSGVVCWFCSPIGWIGALISILYPPAAICGIAEIVCDIPIGIAGGALCASVVCMTCTVLDVLAGAVCGFCVVGTIPACLANCMCMPVTMPIDSFCCSSIFGCVVGIPLLTAGLTCCVGGACASLVGCYGLSSCVSCLACGPLGLCASLAVLPLMGCGSCAFCAPYLLCMMPCLSLLCPLTCTGMCATGCSLTCCVLGPTSSSLFCPLCTTCAKPLPDAITVCKAEGLRGGINAFFGGAPV
jgi:hypothetical protein